MNQEPETVEVKNFEITYFKKQHFNVEVDESHLHLIEAYDYQEAMDKFAELEIGHLWSVDEIVMAQSSFTNKLSADFFLGSMNKHNLGKVEEKGSRNFVVHYPQYQQAPKNW